MAEQPLRQEEIDQVRRVFEYFYPEDPPGCINRELADLAATMVYAATYWSSVFDLVPRPPAAPSFAWLVRQAVMVGWRRATRENRIYSVVRAGVKLRFRGDYKSMRVLTESCDSPTNTRMVIP